ncbi:hypothetical protein BOX15_Mlig004518g1 [Macrostomum lignano]|uniref:Phorbol-ester/DAG-type domain-containing protein n=1 Tax=Macrostomum lignano TaxID=282301 RepID=A0A267EIX1_9PLAT|nr:hypothetical protein BOX15_Mlig004518g1 [Macrostomum lignano]
MLFERLQKAAEKDIPDAAPCVGEIVAAMQDFLDKTNEYKKQAEQLAATKEILRQIQQLPTDLGNPTLIGLHLGNDSFKVKTVKSGKVESIICACILTTKQLIVANKPPRKDGQSTYAFNIPVDTIMEVRKCEKTFALELIQNDGDRVTLECLKRSKDLLSLWKKHLDETKSLNLPNGWNSNGHRFQLITIPEGTKCTKCYQPLPSSVMQGYSCSHCSQTVHIHCFQLVGAARRGTAPALPTQHLAVAAYHKNVTRQRATKFCRTRNPALT